MAHALRSWTRCENRCCEENRRESKNFNQHKTLWRPTPMHGCLVLDYYDGEGPKRYIIGLYVSWEWVKDLITTICFNTISNSKVDSSSVRFRRLDSTDFVLILMSNLTSDFKRWNSFAVITIQKFGQGHDSQTGSIRQNDMLLVFMPGSCLRLCNNKKSITVAIWHPLGYRRADFCHPAMHVRWQ